MGLKKGDLPGGDAGEGLRQVGRGKVCCSLHTAVLAVLWVHRKDRLEGNGGVTVPHGDQALRRCDNERHRLAGMVGMG